MKLAFILISSSLLLHAQTVVNSSQGSSGGGGSSNISLTSGSGAPVANCTAPSTSNINYYLDTTAHQIWRCDNTNHWVLAIESIGSGTFYVSGNHGTDPCGTVASGTDCLFFNSANSNHLSRKDDTGTVHDIEAGGGGSFDPLDQTSTTISRVFNTGTADLGWGVVGTGCNSTSYYGGDTLAPLGGFRLLTDGTDAHTCESFWPNNGSAGVFDGFSGGSPLTLEMHATVRTEDKNGNVYIGLTDYTTATSFIGCYYKKSADLWYAAVITTGTETAITSTTVAGSTATHRFKLTNSSGAANSITCSVDGSSPVTASGTIPSPGGSGWVYVIMSKEIGASAITIRPARISFTVSGTGGAK